MAGFLVATLGACERFAGIEDIHLTGMDGPPADAEAPADGNADALTPADASAESSTDADATAETSTDADATACTTRITYGSSWEPPANHPSSYDIVPGVVTWDGVCTTINTESFATLSDGWRPYFRGTYGCLMALDADPVCGVSAPCMTRVTYGPAWIHSGHPTQYDDVPGRVTWDGVCTTSGTTSSATLSNGWMPVFSGANACAFSLEYSQCGGL